jgi:hypothetical protein
MAAGGRGGSTPVPRRAPYPIQSDPSPCRTSRYWSQDNRTASTRLTADAGGRVPVAYARQSDANDPLSGMKVGGRAVQSAGWSCGRRGGTPFGRAWLTATVPPSAIFWTRALLAVPRSRRADSRVLRIQG